MIIFIEEWLSRVTFTRLISKWGGLMKASVIDVKYGSFQMKRNYIITRLWQVDNI